ncbi:hypothetical protein CDL12_03009 [Handroanthus impetiginosus]|uniref:Aminotransferase-like plant mobile domain-containing protein n=1 Tax=Handroanthus impetiginosus TaxID=429701 RepID=A0A2G9I3C3_9LAMI|nr:hypothetical protein CDL12_03009 [Handroanthus impetiginosus]
MCSFSGGIAENRVDVFTLTIYSDSYSSTVASTSIGFKVLALRFTMVYFKDISSFPGSQQLAVLDDELSRRALVWRYAPLLLVDMQDHGHTHHQHSNELVRDQKSSSSDRGDRQLPNKDFLSMLGHWIIQGKARWGDVLQFVGRFQYIKGYWEWTEDILSRCKHKLDATQIYDFVYASLFTYDRNSEVVKAFFEAWCPLTNTLLTSFGGLSISLWDFHSLAGLPLIGSLYDEVIPSFEELIGVDQTNNRFIPCFCKYLFHAYHLLRKSTIGQFSRVSIEM